MPNIDALLDRVISERDMTSLRICCGEEPPEFVLRDYWEYKRIRDRHDLSPIQAWEFTQLVFSAYKRCERPIHDNPAKPYSIAAEIKRGKLQYGDYVRAFWKGIEQKAFFVEFHPGTKMATVKIDKLERTISADAILGLYKEPQPQPQEA